MKRKVIATILGISLIGSMAAFSMADDTTAAKQAPDRDRNFTVERISEENLNKVLDAMDLTDSEKEAILEKYEENQTILEKIKDLRDQLNNYFTEDMIEKAKELDIIKDNKPDGARPADGVRPFRVASEEELATILDKLELSDSEKEAILEIYESNEAVKEKLEAIKNDSSLTDTEKKEEEKELRSETKSLFTKELLDKIKDLNLVNTQKKEK